MLFIGLDQVGNSLFLFKVRLQTQPRDFPVYTGVIDCAKKTITKEVFASQMFNQKNSSSIFMVS